MKLKKPTPDKRKKEKTSRYLNLPIEKTEKKDYLTCKSVEFGNDLNIALGVGNITHKKA
jgi:hypothetical protein